MYAWNKNKNLTKFIARLERKQSPWSLLLFTNCFWILLFTSTLRASASPPPIPEDTCPEPELFVARQHLVFLQFGELKLYQIISALHARKIHPSAAITLIRDEEADYKRNEWWRILYEADIEVFVVDSSDSILQKFKKVYRHSSVNALDYEYACFVRYFSLQQFMHALDAVSAVMLDIDIVLFDDIFEVLRPNTTFDPHTTFATHWTREGLDEFCEYLMHFYDRDQAAVVAAITKYGEWNEFLAEPLERSELINAWWPEGVGKRQFSDMHFLEAFMKERPGVILSRCFPACEDEVKHLMDPLPNIPGVDCTNVTSIFTAMSWQLLGLHDMHFPYTLSTDKRILGLHFSGYCKKLMPALLCKNLNIEACQQAVSGDTNSQGVRKSLLSNY